MLGRIPNDKDLVSPASDVMPFQAPPYLIREIIKDY